MHYPSSNLKFTKVSNAVAAGTTEVLSDSVNMAGYEGVIFVAQFGAITGSGVGTVTAQGSATDGTTADAFTSIEGAAAIATSSGESNTIRVVDVMRPREQYMRAAITRATANVVLNGVVAIQYGPRDAPVTQATTDLLAQVNFASSAA